MRSIPLVLVALTLACTPQATSDTRVANGGNTGDDAPTNEVDAHPPAPPPTQRVAVGKGHACALRSGGEVWCWGSNTDGQCGVEGEPQVAAPRRVALAGAARAVVAGGRHTCAILDTGSLSCWGWGGFGQLGDGRRQSSSIPVLVSELRDVVDAAAGELHTCALDARGQVWCWGSDSLGQHGRGIPPRPTSPPPSGGLRGLESPPPSAPPPSTPSATSPPSRQGQPPTSRPSRQGQPTSPPESAPPATSPPSPPPENPQNSPFARAEPARDDPPMGGLGFGSGPPSGSPTPQRVPVEGARSIATQEHWTCAIVEDGAVSCWGRDAFDHVRVPTIVEGISQAVAVTVGRRVACALRVDGVASCWGRGDMGQLGDGTHESRADARPVVELVDVVEIGAGDERACARLANGTVWCWGSGGLGDHYRRTGAPTPHQAHELEGAVALGVGPDDACATIADESTWCWGDSTRLPTRIE